MRRFDRQTGGWESWPDELCICKNVEVLITRLQSKGNSLPVLEITGQKGVSTMYLLFQKEVK